MKANRKIVIIAHNLRSSLNVGSLLRTADGLGIERVYLTGYTPYPMHDGDTRLPHIARKVHDRIAKTALGAEQGDFWQHHDSITLVLEDLRSQGFRIAALEQSAAAVPLPTFIPGNAVAIIIGREVEGIEAEVIDAADVIVEIPMFGDKESFNVVQAAAMAMYHCRFR